MDEEMTFLTSEFDKVQNDVREFKTNIEVYMLKLKACIVVYILLYILKIKGYYL